MSAFRRGASSRDPKAKLPGKFYARAWRRSRSPRKRPRDGSRTLNVLAAWMKCHGRPVGHVTCSFERTAPAARAIQEVQSEASHPGRRRRGVASERSHVAPVHVGFRGRGGRQRAAGARAGADLPPVRRGRRSRDAWVERDRSPPGSQRGAARRHRHHRHRSRQHRHGGDRGARRRLRLPDQARRSAPTAHGAEQGHREGRGRARGHAAPPPARGRPRHGSAPRDQRRHEGSVPPHRAGRAHHRPGPDLRGDGHGQGAGGPHHPRAVASRRSSRSSPSTAPPFRTRCSRASCSATRRARSPARSIAAPDCSSSRIRVLSSSTRSPR